MSSGIGKLTTERQSAFLNGLVILSQMFWSPDPAFCREMLEPGFAEELKAFNRLISKESESEFGEIISYLAGFQGAEALFAALEESYIRLFISSPQGVGAPLYQSYYESKEGLLMGEPAKVMRERLLGIGFDVDAGTEPADHLAFEIEYLFLLLEKGLAEGDGRLVARAENIARDEMAPWVFRFEQKIAEADDGVSFYKRIAGLLVRALSYLGR